MDKKAEAILAKFEKLKSDRHNWNSHWDEVAEYFVPRKDEALGAQTRGEKKFNLLYDSTSVQANETLASALQGMLTNPTSIWFGLSSGNKNIDKIKEVREWLQEATLITLKTLNDSNFNSEVYEVYIDLGGLGTSLFRVLEDDDDIVNFESRPIYEAHIAENMKGIVDTVYYKYDMTHEQMFNKFGHEAFAMALTDGDMKRAKELVEKDPLGRKKVLHAVEPRDKIRHTLPSMAPKNMKFASFWVCCETRKMLEEKGFHENPYIVSRWSKYSGEVYGRSPGMKALSDAKMLNKMKKATIEAAQLDVAPPMQVPDDGVLLPIRTTPNSINYYRAGSKDRIEPLRTGSKIQMSEALMESVRNQIRQAFFIDQLNIPQQDRMTATEVMQRRDEQLRMLGPTLARQHFEFLKPLIKRVFGILARRGMLPEAPPELQGMELQVEYTSLIAKAQQAAEGDNLMRAVSLIAPFAETDPSMLDNFNGDEIVKFASRIYGLPADILRGEREVQQMRDGRAQAQQEMNDQAEEAHTAEVINKVGLNQQ